jgi:hypothetical protein
MVDERTSLMKLSLPEFLMLARYSNGRLRNLSEVFLDLTEEQVEMLHGDDWSYYHELKEELAYEMSYYL